VIRQLLDSHAMVKVAGRCGDSKSRILDVHGDVELAVVTLCRSDATHIEPSRQTRAPPSRSAVSFAPEEPPLAMRMT
jgi:hypothetical protein